MSRVRKNSIVDDQSCSARILTCWKRFVVMNMYSLCSKGSKLISSERVENPVRHPTSQPVRAEHMNRKLNQPPVPKPEVKRDVQPF